MSDKILKKNIVDEMNNSFLDYAMSVIVSRALPDVRDGLKPVHRRILFAMNDLGNTADKPYKKSARIVGDVIGKYHPHGDTSVYDAMVRMSQDFSYRSPLVDGHGNFGSLDGDGAAAMRYTEARMSRMAMELLKDINKDTIDFQDNYDGSESEPSVLPASYPNLLVNGANGIAVGMATSIPTHNLGEVIDGTISYINNKEITISELMKDIKGPDFPLGANILGTAGIIKAYETGNGSVKVRSEYEVFEDKKGKNSIVITEIPFQVNKASMVEKIAECVKEKRVEGITDLRDESDRDGIRVVIELSRGTSPEVVMNNLFKNTQLESSFSMNMLALVKGEPKVLNLKEMIVYYVDHQVEVLRRKTQFELTKAEKRAHILEGLRIALDSIDRVISLIRGSKTQEEALMGLISQFSMSEIQAKAILEMQLRRLTGLEREKIDEEFAELMALIEELNKILASEEKVNEIIVENLLIVKEKYANDRRSRIVEGYFDSNIDYEDLIEETNTIITLTSGGYVKRISPEEYKTQARGGKGKIGMKLNEEDIVTNMIFTSTHSDLLFFTDKGRVLKTRAHRVPLTSRTAKGLPLVNLIDIEKEETITKIESIKEYEENAYLMFVTKNGLGKKTKISEYERINKNGKKALGLNEGDVLSHVLIVKENEQIMFATTNAKVLLTEQSNFRPLSRVSKGVTAIRFSDDHSLVSSSIVSEEHFIISISSNGFGKATSAKEYRIQARGGKGVRGQSLSEKTGDVVATLSMTQEEINNSDLLMITKNGQVIRIDATTIKHSGRSTKGVTLMRLNEGDSISTVEIINKESVEENEVN